MDLGVDLVVLFALMIFTDNYFPALLHAIAGILMGTVGYARKLPQVDLNSVSIVLMCIYFMLKALVPPLHCSVTSEHAWLIPTGDPPPL